MGRIPAAVLEISPKTFLRSCLYKLLIYIIKMDKKRKKRKKRPSLKINALNAQKHSVLSSNYNHTRIRTIVRTMLTQSTSNQRSYLRRLLISRWKESTQLVAKSLKDLKPVNFLWPASSIRWERNGSRKWW